MTDPAQRVLVTGGAGYIGSHACKCLALHGCLPIAFDNLLNGRREAVLWGPLVEGDVQDSDRLDEAFRIHRPTAVLHFAALAAVGESVTKPELYYRNNVGGTLNLLSTMLRHGVRGMVFSSTCSTYGMPRSIPISEDHPQEPINPYGSSKLMVERILRDMDSAHGLRSVSLRYFNAAGADPEGEIGEDHEPETHLIPVALDAALGLRDHLALFGQDYDTPDGTCVRDYIHVADLAEAHLRALRHLEGGGATTALNLGSEKGYSVREVIATAEQVSGRRVPVKFAGRREGDPPSLVAQSAKARAVLGWKPALGSLDTIVEHAWRWRLKRAQRLGRCA